MLPFYLLFPARLLARLLFGADVHKLIGRAVSVRIVDTEDSGMVGEKVQGKIERMIKRASTTGPRGQTNQDDFCPVIRLEDSLNLRGQKINSIIVWPRSQGEDFTLLPLTSMLVHLHNAENVNEPAVLKLEELLAIGLIRLIHRG